MRYAIEDKEGNVSPDKYSITFTQTDDDSFTAKLMENDPVFRRLVFQQHHEKTELSARHSQEMVAYVAKARRAAMVQASRDRAEE